MKTINNLVFALVVFAQTSCMVSYPKNIIFDNDMGNDVDDALALVMLYNYAEEGKANILGLTSNKVEPSSPMFLDVMNTYYGHPEIPISKLTGYKQYDRPNTFSSQIVDAGKYERTVADFDDFPESVDLLRKLLSEADNKSVDIVAVGFFTNLSLLLKSGPDEYSRLDGMTLVKRKVRSLHVMAGDFRARPTKEHNVYFDIPSAIHVFENWPTPIVASPFELGLSVRYPSWAIEQNLGYSRPNPVVEGYKLYVEMPHNRPSWDLSSVLECMEPDGGYFVYSPKGTITVTQDGKTVFKEDPKGRHQYIEVTPDKNKKIIDRYLQLTLKR